MEFKSNIEQIITRFKELADKGESLDFTEALTVGVNAALGSVKNRVFNTGRDAQGISFGKYTGRRSRATTRRYLGRNFGDETKKERKKLRKGIKPHVLVGDQFTEYEKERIARGRQIKYKDLEMTGDLRTGIKVMTENPQKVVAAIPNEKLFKISQWQELQISKIIGMKVNIWGLSDEERELMKTNIDEALTQLYARLYNP